MNRVIITQHIKDEFLKQIEHIFKNGKLMKKQNKKVLFEVNRSDLDVLIKKKLGKFDPSINLNKLILADFEYLKQLTEYIDKNQDRTQLTKLQKDYFYTSYARLKKAEYVKILDVSTCLYCNRNYVFNFTKNSSLEATAQIDHFFDKKTYPYLAISLHNLIPSCPTCNQRKSTKQEEIVHPFVESFDEQAKFILTIADSSFYHSLKGFEITLHPKTEKAKSSIEMFNLEHLYQNHKDIVLEIIQKQAMYNESYMDELLREYEGTLFKNKEDLQRLIGGGYITQDEINKRPLSKLLKDISVELGMV